ncbi:MAG: protein kinase domain-containing protein [Lachnospiraceae bacterium]
MELIKDMCPNCFSWHYHRNSCADCGYINQPNRNQGRAMTAGTLLGNRYFIGRILGVGGFGITYKAYDYLHREVCAIKEYAPAGITYRNQGEKEIQVSMTSGKSVFHHGMIRFLQEAERLKQLFDIDDVVKIKDSFSQNGTAYFVMEYLDGTNLKQVIRMANRPVRADDITEMIARIGMAMSVIHKTTGILHRDITPENIYLLKDGTAKLLDFGSARQQTMDERQEFSVEFKKGFAPPEQYYRTGKQGPYTDVYSLAATYYFALTKRTVPDAIERLDGKICPPLYQLRSDIAHTLSLTVEQALELDYRRRIQTMDQFVKGICPKMQQIAMDYDREVQAKAYLQIVSGEKTGMRWEVPPGKEIKIGRSPMQNHIIITGNAAVSKIHCTIIYDERNSEFRIEDFSRNGTYVNGNLLSKGQIYRYPPGVVISLTSRMCELRAGVSNDGQ